MHNGRGEREGEAGKGKMEVTTPLRGYKLSMMMLTYKLGMSNVNHHECFTDIQSSFLSVQNIKKAFFPHLSILPMSLSQLLVTPVYMG